MRWFGLACFLILLFMAWRKGELRNYAIALIAGCVVGFVIDYVGISLRLWEFPRQPFLSWQYFAIVVPCWGVFGATINMVNDWHMRKGWVSIFILAVAVMAVYEIPNILTESWGYTVSTTLIILGWFPMIVLFRLSFLFMVSRSVRTRVYKLLEIENVPVDDRIKNTH